MVFIYCIEDINDLKYVGSTTQKLNIRFSGHKSNKSRGQYCSSSKLILENSIIYVLEECDLNNRSEREKYWINKIDCVNDLKLNSQDPKIVKKRKEKYRSSEKGKQKEKEYAEIQNRRRREKYQNKEYRDEHNRKRREIYQKNKSK
tara:strand:+ start:95 stop:532 length:438 start_codon:yes stop_codon:yes gene_type:complete